MSVPGSSPSSVDLTEESEVPPARARKRRTAIFALLGVAAAVIVAAGAMVAWHVWTHPDVFPDQGVSWRAGPRPVNKAVSVPVTWAGTGDPTTVTFHTAQATFAVNTAAAHVTFEICQRRPGQVFTTPYGSLRPYCTSVTPLTSGTAMTYPADPFAHQYVMVTITPTRPGLVELTNVRFTYALPSHHLPRPISDDVALDVTIPVR